MFAKYIFNCILLCLLLNSNTVDADAIVANGLIDQVLDAIQRVYGHLIDPIAIPDQKIKLDSILGILGMGGSVSLINGKLYGMSAITRKGDCILDFDNKLIAVKLLLGPDKKLRATYSSQYELLGLKGITIETESEAEDVLLNITISFDPLRSALNLSHIYIEELNNLTVHFENTGFLRSFTDALTDMYHKAFNSEIRSVLSNILAETIRKALSVSSPPKNLFDV